MQTQILIADDHPLFRKALAATVLQNYPDAQLLEAEDLATLQDRVKEHPDVSLILLDLNMPGAEGFGALVYLISQQPQTPVMVVSAMDHPQIIARALEHGASGFLPKSAPTEAITEALSTVLEGNIWAPEGMDTQCGTSEPERTIAEALGSLTPQQFRVASMLSQGLLNKQIAFELNVTEATVKAHMTEIFRKLGVHSRTQAAVALGQLAVSPGNTLSDFEGSVSNS